MCKRTTDSTSMMMTLIGICILLSCFNTRVQGNGDVWIMESQLSLSNVYPSIVTVDLSMFNLTAICQTDVQNFIDNLLNKTEWALQMFDSWGKLPDGILMGNINSVGDFDECMDAKLTTANETLYEPLVGQYCTASLISKANKTQLTPTFGVCLPSTCTSTEVATFVNTVFGNVSPVFEDNWSTMVYETSCSTVEDNPLDTGSYIVLAIFSFFILLVIMTTFIDLFMSSAKKSTNNQTSRFLASLRSFSFLANGKKLLDTTTQTDDVACIHGIRFITMTWVILLHTWYAATLVPLKNSNIMPKMYENWTLLTVLNATVAVDTFLVLSGMLVAYGALKQMDTMKGMFSLPVFYLRRYLRLTPVYAAVVAYTAVILPRLSNGPFWWQFKMQCDWCVDNWWLNLLYVNNFFHLNAICFGESWYLSVDMQLFVISPLVLYVLWKCPKLGIIMAIVGAIGSIACTAVISYVNHFLPTSIPFKPMSIPYFQQLYMRPYTRAAPYIIGLVLGYVFHKYRGKTIQLPKAVVAIGWIVSTTTCLIVIYGIYPYFKVDVYPSNITSAVYSSLHRVVWALGIAWIILACSNGYGGPVATILSWKPFIPLGRLSYSCYLISLQMQQLLHYSQKVLINYSTYTMVNLYFAHLIMSLLVAFCFSIVFELPFLQLDKLLFPRKDVSIETKETKPNYGSITTIGLSTGSQNELFKDQLHHE